MLSFVLKDGSVERYRKVFIKLASSHGFNADKLSVDINGFQCYTKKTVKVWVGNQKIQITIYSFSP